MTELRILDNHLMVPGPSPWRHAPESGRNDDMKTPPSKGHGTIAEPHHYLPAELDRPPQHTCDGRNPTSSDAMSQGQSDPTCTNAISSEPTPWKSRRPIPAVVKAGITAGWVYLTFRLFVSSEYAEFYGFWTFVVLAVLFWWIHCAQRTARQSRRTAWRKANWTTLTDQQKREGDLGRWAGETWNDLPDSEREEVKLQLLRTSKSLQ
jgi:hypothetical protein